MQAATPLPLLLLGIAAGTGGLYGMLSLRDDSPELARWLGPTFVATALLPVLALVGRGDDWPASILDRWYWIALFALLAIGSTAAAVIVVTSYRKTHGVVGFSALLFCCAGICCFQQAYLTALILAIGGGAIAALLRRHITQQPNDEVLASVPRPREPVLACLMGTVLATTLVSAVHASVDPEFGRSATGEKIRTTNPAESELVPPAPDVRLAHHSLVPAVLIFALGCVGISTRREPLAMLLSSGVVIVGVVSVLASGGGLHDQPIGDLFAGLVLGVAAVVCLLLRTTLTPLLLAARFEEAEMRSDAENVQRPFEAESSASRVAEERDG